MDFNLPESALAVREGGTAVGAKYDHGYWSPCDEEHRFPHEAWLDLDGGWIGLGVAEEYGGGGQGMLELAVACESLASSGGTAGTFLYILTPGFGASVENAGWMVAVTRTTPTAEARPRTAGFTLFLVDVKQALAAGTLSYSPIPKRQAVSVTRRRRCRSPATTDASARCSGGRSGPS